MSSHRDDATPLAMATGSDEEITSTTDNRRRSLHRKRRIFCCCAGCAATLAIVGLTLAILFLTVFKVKPPKLSLNSVTVEQLALTMPTSLTSSPSLNITVTSDMSVKNPNAASLRFGYSKTEIYYRGVLAGVAYGPPGTAGARSTFGIKLTVDVMADRVSDEAGLASDLAAGALGLNSTTRVAGRVKMLGLKHHVEVVLRCAMTLLVQTQKIADQSCAQRVRL